jgi:hypothetical protein
MIPTIIISATASVLSGVGSSMKYSSTIISCITAFGAFLLAINNLYYLYQYILSKFCSNKCTAFGLNDNLHNIKYNIFSII